MSGSLHQEDVALVARATGGDVRAREEVFLRIGGRIRTMARYLTYDPQQADDAAQDVVVQVLCALSGYRGEARLETWADGVALRTLRKRFRKARRWARESSWDLATWPSTGPDPEQQAMWQEQVEHLAWAVSRLPDILAEALVVRLVLGYSVRDSAVLTGVGENTFRDRLRRARQDLRKLILETPRMAERILDEKSENDDRL